VAPLSVSGRLQLTQLCHRLIQSLLVFPQRSLLRGFLPGALLELRIPHRFHLLAGRRHMLRQPLGPAKTALGRLRFDLGGPSSRS
jgi:hypothetical protein